MMKPIAHAGAWMMQVARNRITDLFRCGNREVADDGEQRILEDLLPSPEAGPDALYARGLLLAEISATGAKQTARAAHLNELQSPLDLPAWQHSWRLTRTQSWMRSRTRQRPFGSFNSTGSAGRRS